MRNRFFAAVMSGVLVLAAPGAQAQGWSSLGAPIVEAPHAALYVHAVSDGADGVIVAWTQDVATTAIAAAQRVGADGVPVAGWPAGGLVLCSNPDARPQVGAIASDGAGGAFVAWQDLRSINWTNIALTHVRADGTIDPAWPEDGLVIAPIAQDQRQPVLVADGDGGVFVAWSDGRNSGASFTRDVYATHLQGDGTRVPGWAADAMPVTVASTVDDEPAIATDGGTGLSAGLYASWTRTDAGGNQQVGAQHLGANGQPAATWPDTGIVLTSGPTYHNSSRIVTGAGGRAIAVWQDRHDYGGGDTEIDYVAQCFGPDTACAAGWAHAGRVVAGNTNRKYGPMAVADGSGGVLVAWGERPTFLDENVYVAHMDGSGLLITSVDFPDGIVTACAAAADQDPSSIAADGTGGAFVGWADWRNGTTAPFPSDVYVQHVLATARVANGWPGDGVALTQGPAAEVSPLVVAAGTTDVIAVWQRSGGVFASKVIGDGSVGTGASLLAASAAGGIVRVTWQVSAPPGCAYLVERREAATGWRELARVTADTEGRLGLEDRDVIAGGRYGYRLSDAASGTVADEAWITVPAFSPALRLAGPWPNPIAERARVSVELPLAGAATLVLVDAQGRAVRQWDVGGDAGEHELQLGELGGAPPGVYWLRLVQGGRSQAKRVALVR